MPLISETLDQGDYSSEFLGSVVARSPCLGKNNTMQVALLINNSANAGTIDIQVKPKTPGGFWVSLEKIELSAGVNAYHTFIANHNCLYRLYAESGSDINVIAEY